METKPLSYSEIQRLFDDLTKNFSKLNLSRVKPSKVKSLLDSLKRLLLLKSDKLEVIKWRCYLLMSEYKTIFTLWLNAAPSLQNEIKAAITTCVENIPSSCQAEKKVIMQNYKAFFTTKYENNSYTNKTNSKIEIISDNSNQINSNVIKLNNIEFSDFDSKRKKNEEIISTSNKNKLVNDENDEESCLLNSIDKILSNSSNSGKNDIKVSTSIIGSKKQKNDNVLRVRYDNENNIQQKKEQSGIKSNGNYNNNYKGVNNENDIPSNPYSNNGKILYKDIKELANDTKEKVQKAIFNNNKNDDIIFDFKDFLPKKKSALKQQNKEKQKEESEMNKENYYVNKSRSRSKTHKIEKTINRLEELVSLIKGFGSPLQFLKQYLSTEHGKIIYEKLRDYKKEYLSEETLNRLITLTCLFFPFFSKSQKNDLKVKLSQILPDTVIHYLDYSLLYSFSQIGEQNRDVITSLILSKPLPSTFSIKITNEKDIIDKYIIFTVYKVSIDERNKGTFDIHHKQIMFALINVLKHYDKIPFLVQSSKIFNALYLIKNFYALLNQKFDKEYLTYNDIDKQLSFNDIVISEDEFHSLNDLFSAEELDYYSNIINTIGNFYEIDSDNEIYLNNSSFNLQFVNSIIDLIEFKRAHLYNNISSYRDNLIKLESEIASLAMQRNKELSQFTIDAKLRKQFNNLYSLLKSNFMNEDFSLYPFGSITQFLSNESSDLDIYIDLSRVKDKVQFLTKLDQYINNNIDNNSKATISTRICVISLTFENLKIDLSYLGFCPYLHSNILRTYSLIDARFPILVICVKHIIKKLNIKNEGYNKFYLNSFCWVMLLITFLQDLIKPAVLPKILENSKQVKKTISLGGLQQLNINTKTFFNFCNNTYSTNIIAPVDNYKNYIEIYENTITEKNNMSLSEILIKFFEFVSFYFKYDAIYINFFFIGEGIQNISHIYQNKSNDEEFYTYYKKKYKEHRIKMYNRPIMTEKDGLILFREPFDGNYNPGQTFRDRIKSDEFFEKIRYAYRTLVLTGSIDTINSNLL